MLAAFFAGRCDAISNDLINLVANRQAAPDASALILLPELLQKELHGMLVRNGDAEWAALTSSSVLALIQIEESGLTHVDVPHVREITQDPQVCRLLGLAET